MTVIGPSATCCDVRLRAAVEAIADVMPGMATADLDARADRVAAITEGNFGEVISRDGTS